MSLSASDITNECYKEFLSFSVVLRASIISNPPIQPISMSALQLKFKFNVLVLLKMDVMCSDESARFARDFHRMSMH